MRTGFESSMTSLRASHDACVGYDDVKTPLSQDALSGSYEIESQYLDSVVEDILFDEAIEVSFCQRCFVLVYLLTNEFKRLVHVAHKDGSIVTGRTLLPRTCGKCSGTSTITRISFENR